MQVVKLQLKMRLHGRKQGTFSGMRKPTCCSLISVKFDCLEYLCQRHFRYDITLLVYGNHTERATALDLPFGLPPLVRKLPWKSALRVALLDWHRSI